MTAMQLDPRRPSTPNSHGQQPGGSLHAQASAGSPGFMSAADKVKVDASGPGTAYAFGTVTSGTITPNPANGLFGTVTNNGAHTLAPPSTGAGDAVQVILLYTNAASAGAVTTSGFTKVIGSFTTTNGHKFKVTATVIGGSSCLEIVALQ